MGTSKVRVLVVDDHESMRQWVCSTLRTRPELQVIGEASDGLEAVHKAQELHPDLIVLDIGLPTLNGLDAARQIHALVPESKILFLSQYSSAEIVEGALSSGALGYVTKMHAGTDLLNAVEAVCQGKRFFSHGLPGHHFTGAMKTQVPGRLTHEGTLPSMAARAGEITRRHEVQFYSDDASFLVGLTAFIEAALKAGNAVIVIATESHRTSLLGALQAHGVDVAAAVALGRYNPLDAAETLSTFMESTGPNRERFLSAFGALIRFAENAAEGREKQVVVFGEMVALLCAEGRIQAAIELERLANEVSHTPLLHVRCAYPMTEQLQGEPYAAICAEHSAVLPVEA
jgi:DNA-binding NarL/FixJ family response regulator